MSENKKIITLKQIRFAKELPTAKSFAEAKRKAGYSKNTPTKGILESVRNREGFKEILDEAGLDYESIAKVYREVIEEGKHSDKLRALELMHKIRGDFAPTKTENKEVDSFEDFIVKSIDKSMKK